MIFADNYMFPSYWLLTLKQMDKNIEILIIIFLFSVYLFQ